MLTAAVDGLGLAQLPEPIARKQLHDGELEELLPEHASSSAGLFLYFPSRNQVMPKLRAFIDHVKARSAIAAQAAPPASKSTKGSRSRR
jgi:DNA-binding transcriptional LysR family regulator